ncbi:feruloyl esterase B [Coniochaeta ligniaria NRRL 30616]|uniref:Carboxylic ester hydrolase n=1 Tax=Coniochaeta ligniaria NRRL 30616 TaxID=1408157 RepID=A0A1J7J0M9_9PEZI|nr:feruloyl esterase B [Coniochaeta ligniaria NRRL 30616]
MGLSALAETATSLLFGALSFQFGNATSNAACSVATFNEILGSSASVISAVKVENGGTYGEGALNLLYPTNPTNLPSLCAVTVKVTSSPESSYRFGIFLPESWNSRFMAVGNAGFGGGINWMDMAQGVRYGHAAVSTDTGHNSTMGDNTWALNKPETQKDFGYRAVHGSVELGKKIAEEYYGSKIKYSYYMGGSTGGRQGLKEAQISPDSFDGMVIGAPAWWTSHMQPWTTKVATYNLPVDGPNRVPPSLFPVIEKEVLRQCDGVDGLVDGIITRPDLCEFDYSALACSGSEADSSSCLTATQIETVQKIYSPYIADGKFAFPGLELSSESQWAFLLSGDAPSSFGDGYIQNFLLNDPNWSWTTYRDSLLWEADAADPGTCDADGWADLAAFRDRGGKIFMYHGQADALIPFGSGGLFYNKTAEVLGGHAALLDWFRYFEVPGMQHVTGTAEDAPWYFAGANAAAVLGTDVYSTPGFEDAGHDALLAVMDWVEKGEPIDEIVATTWTAFNDASSGVLRQRPLCPYPKKQTYDGTGDEKKPESFSCI